LPEVQRAAKIPVGNGLSIHIGELLHREVRDEVVTEGRQLRVQASVLRFLLESSNDETANHVCQACHAQRQLPWCVHYLSLMSQKVIQESSYGLDAHFVPLNLVRESR